jgi:hypothetical protein
LKLWLTPTSPAIATPQARNGNTDAITFNRRRMVIAQVSLQKVQSGPDVSL